MKPAREYKTKQGEMIVNYLKDNKGSHVTAEDIIDYFKSRDITIGKSTVYRQLDKLVKDGFVRKFFIEEGMSACFQYIDEEKDCNNHFHLKCINCGKLIHIECNYLQEADKHILTEHKFEVDNTKTVLYGRCDKCSK